MPWTNIKEHKETCRLCNKEHTVKIDWNDYLAWKEGALIQNAFPYLTSDERELLVSKTCGPCFDKIFGKCADSN